MAGKKELELTIRIAGKMDKSLTAAINGTQSRVSELARDVSRIGTVGLAAMGTLATGTVAALAKCTDAASDFENQMANVVKYVGGLADATGEVSDSIWSASEGGNGQTYAQNYEAMSGALLDLSTQIPMTAEDLTQLAAAAGQSGKSITDLIQYDGEGNIGGFLKDVAMMGTAMDISAEQAGDWAAKWEHSFNMTHDQVMVLSDQINYLGANNATTAAEIAQVVNDSAALGQIAGMSADSTAALATAMLAMGVDTGKAATGINRIYTNLSLGASATKAQREMWQSLGYTAEGIAKSMQADATGTMIDVFESIGNMDADKQVAALKTLFGQWAIQGAAKLTGNLDAFTDALGMVNDPSLYNGSMEREFIIKASTSGAIDTMMSNSFQALQIDAGTAFLPAKKEISESLIGFMNQLRSMPELGTIAEQLATLFSQGVQWAGEALENALPYIQQALDYLINHGPEVVDVLGKLAAAFAAMKFAPGITNLLGGAGNMIFAAKTGAEKTPDKTGGLTGMISGLFKGGQNAGTAAAGLVSSAAGAVKGNGFRSTLSTMASSLISGNGIQGTTQLLQFGAANSGALSGYQGIGSTILQSVGSSGVGQYLGNVGSSLGNFLNQSGISGIARGTVNVSGEILSNIAQATGLTDFVHGSIGLVRTGAGKAAGGVARMASNVANSAPVQAIGGLAGRVVNSAPIQGIASMTKGAAGWIGRTVGSGVGLLSGVWGPMASGFGGLLSGALPVVGVISSVIAASSLLYDNMDGLGQIVRSVFGEDAFQGFQKFQDGLDGVVNSVGKLLSGDFAGFTASLRETLFGKYDVFTVSMMGCLFSGS